MFILGELCIHVFNISREKWCCIDTAAIVPIAFLTVNIPMVDEKYLRAFLPPNQVIKRLQMMT